MSASNLVLRSVYVDPDVDDKLREQAAGAGLNKADLFRHYLNAGIKAVRAKPELFDQAAQSGETPPLVMRSIYMDPKLDDKLRVEAFDSRKSKNDLMRRYVRVGMALQSKPTSTTVVKRTRGPRSTGMRAVAKVGGVGF